MAYTSVIPVRRLDRAVKYVMNKEKTTAVSLQDALDYAANRDKTEQSCFESSYACTLETAFADMRQTKERWHKSGGVQGYHLVQSFAAGEDIVAGQVRHAAEDKPVQLVERAEVEAQVAAPRDVIKNIRH